MHFFYFKIHGENWLGNHLATTHNTLATVWNIQASTSFFHIMNSNSPANYKNDFHKLEVYH